VIYMLEFHITVRKKGNKMQLGEVALLTNDVVKLVDFYNGFAILNFGVEIIDKPKTRPWGARNMSFYDPDRNIVYLRSFSKI